MFNLFFHLLITYSYSLCRGQYFNALKDNCLVWNVIGWSDKRNITWLREHAKLRRTGKHPQERNGWRTEKTLCSYSVYNNCIFACFDTRLCKLVSLHPYGIVVNLVRFSRFPFPRSRVITGKRNSYTRGARSLIPCDKLGTQPG